VSEFLLLTLMSTGRWELCKSYHRVIKWLICSDARSFNLKLFSVVPGLHQPGLRRAKQERIPLFCPLPQQQPSMGGNHQVAHPYWQVPWVSPPVWVQTLLQWVKNTTKRNLKKPEVFPLLIYILMRLLLGEKQEGGANWKHSEGALLISRLLRLLNSTLKTSWTISAGQNSL